MSVYVVVHYGYENCDFELEAAFSTRAAAESWVAAGSAEYVSPARYAKAHYAIKEVSLDAVPP